MSNNKTYFGFAVADSMFPTTCTIRKQTLTSDQMKDRLQLGVEVCLNPSHQATIDAMKMRYEFVITIPEKAPIVSLKSGDSVLVMSVRGLPRLEGGHEYTTEEIEKATFAFSMYSVE